MDRGVLILAFMLGLGFLLMLGAGLHSLAEQSCTQAGFRPFPPNRLSGPVRMLPEIIR